MATPSPWQSRGAVLGIAAALAILVAAVFWQVHSFEFVNWDDQIYLTDNPTVQAGLSPANVWWALTTTHSPYWHPMTWLSHLLDVTLYGMNPGPQHVTSLLLHLANTLFLFAILRRATGDTAPSAFVAAIFGVHPLHVESVAWLAERKDVLSTFFWMVTVWSYLRYADRPSAGRYGLVVAGYALALMSKPMVVTLPFVLLLLDWWPLRRAPSVRLVVEKIPLLLMAGGVVIATVIVQRRVGAVAAFAALPLGARLANASVSYLLYLWKTIWPTGLAAFYPLHPYAAWQVGTAVTVLAAATAGAFLLRRRAPSVLTGWIWYLVTILPVIGLTQAGEQARADRFMYVPMIGLLVIVAWGLPMALDSGALSRRTARRVLTGVAVLVILASAAGAHAQAETWADSLSLWRHAAAAVPGNYLAYQDLCEALRDRGRLAEALPNCRQALAVSPANSPGLVAMIHNDIGLILAAQEQPAEAAGEFDQAVRLSPGFAEAHNNFGNALAAQGRYPEAIAHFTIAVGLKPDFTEAQVGLGGALLNVNRPADALPHYAAALAQDPQLAEAHNGRGAALAMLGRDGPALAEYNEALRLRPNLPTAHLNIAVLLIRAGQRDEARQQLRAALAIDPGYEPARQLLARLR